MRPDLALALTLAASAADGPLDCGTAREKRQALVREEAAILRGATEVGRALTRAEAAQAARIRRRREQLLVCG